MEIIPIITPEVQTGNYLLIILEASTYLAGCWLGDAITPIKTSRHPVLIVRKQYETGAAMSSAKTSKNNICPQCGSTGKLERIQQKIYSPPVTKQDLISQIDKCLDCDETFGTVSKYQQHKEQEDDV